MLFTIKKILVATDLSPSSDEALKCAQKIKEKTEAEVSVCYIAEHGLKLPSEENFSPIYENVILSPLKSQHLSQIHAQLDRTQLQANIILGEGNVTKELIKHSQDYHLLIVGHGRHLPGARILGSVARKLIGHTSIPLMIINRPLHFTSMATLLNENAPADWMVAAGFDFYRSLKYQHLFFFTCLMRIWGDSLKMDELHAQEKIQSEIHFFTREGEKAEMITEKSTQLYPTDTLVKMLSEHKVDLTLLGKKKWMHWRDLFKSSEALRLLETRVSNLLIIPI